MANIDRELLIEVENHSRAFGPCLTADNTCLYSYTKTEPTRDSATTSPYGVTLH